jgi:hypothetical protein
MLFGASDLHSGTKVVITIKDFFKVQHSSSAMGKGVIDFLDNY